MTVSEKHMATARDIGSRWWCSHCRCRSGLECQPVKEIAAAIAAAEREGMKRAAEIAKNLAEQTRNSLLLPGAYNEVADLILSQAGEA